MEYASLALAGAIAVSLLLLLFGIRGLFRSASGVTDRLRTYTSLAESGASQTTEDDSLRVRLDSSLAQSGIGARIASKLAQADVKVTVSEYLLINLGLAALGFLFGFNVFKSPVLGAIVAGLMLPVPHFYVSNAQAKRLSAFNEQLPNALVSLANALRGGYGIVQAMSLTAEEMTPPMSVEFGRVVTETGYGLPYDVSFQNMLRRNPSEDLGLVVTALQIHLEMGGNLAEILDSIAAIIRDRVRIQGQIRALTAQQRLSASILTMMPLIVISVMYVVNKAYISLLWTTPEGLVMSAIAAVLLIMGSIMVRRVSVIRV